MDSWLYFSPSRNATGSDVVIKIIALLFLLFVLSMVVLLIALVFIWAGEMGKALKDAILRREDPHLADLRGAVERSRRAYDESHDGNDPL